MFIVFEGIDASGKETQTKLLFEYPHKSFVSVKKIDFPKYDSHSGKLISDYLLSKWDISWSDSSQKLEIEKRVATSSIVQALYLANRMECLPDEVWHASKHHMFIADRYYMSGLAYGKSTGAPVDWLRTIHRNLPQPDITILLDISVEESFKRRSCREDKFEKDKSMLEKTRQTYIDLFAQEGKDYYIVDANRSKEDIFQDILGIVSIKEKEKSEKDG